MADLNIRIEKIIDLTQFGGEGELIVAPQSLQAIAWEKNQQAHHVLDITVGEDDELKKNISKEVDIGDLEIVTMLSYIRRAPFKLLNLKAFYAYCDTLEDKCPGISVDLGIAIQKAIVEVKEAAHPLDN